MFNSSSDSSPQQQNAAPLDFFSHIPFPSIPSTLTNPTIANPFLNRHTVASPQPYFQFSRNSSSSSNKLTQLQFLQKLTKNLQSALSQALDINDNLKNKMDLLQATMVMAEDINEDLANELRKMEQKIKKKDKRIEELMKRLAASQIQESQFQEEFVEEESNQ